MRRKAAWIILVLATLLWLVSSFENFTAAITEARYTSEKWWGSDKFRYGDLYGLSYLPKFRIKDPQGPYILKDADSLPGGKNIDLYALSDSYTWHAFSKPSLFYNTASSRFAVSNAKEVISTYLNKDRKNVMIIESSERNLRKLFTKREYLASFLNVLEGEAPKADPKAAAPEKKDLFSLKLKFRIKDLDPNIEFNTYDYRLFTPFKEHKAALTYKWFNRVNSDVYLSPDQKYLLYGITIDSTQIESSFKHVSTAEVNELVDNLNNAYTYYKSRGFDEIYLSIIPNPVTVLFPDFKGMRHNNIIQKIQGHKALKLKVIDSYGPFRESKKIIYCYSDSHWNFEGNQLWLDQVNKVLKPIAGGR